MEKGGWFCPYCKKEFCKKKFCRCELKHISKKSYYCSPHCSREGFKIYLEKEREEASLRRKERYTEEQMLKIALFRTDDAYKNDETFKQEIETNISKKNDEITLRRNQDPERALIDPNFCKAWTLEEELEEIARVKFLPQIQQEEDDIFLEIEAKEEEQRIQREIQALKMPLPEKILTTVRLFLTFIISAFFITIWAIAMNKGAQAHWNETKVSDLVSVEIILLPFVFAFFIFRFFRILWFKVLKNSRFGEALQAGGYLIYFLILVLLIIGLYGGWGFTIYVIYFSKEEWSSTIRTISYIGFGAGIIFLVPALFFLIKDWFFSKK